MILTSHYSGNSLQTYPATDRPIKIRGVRPDTKRPTTLEVQLTREDAAKLLEDLNQWVKGSILAR